jgi:Bacterial NAD-glutamate dehydrogenase
MRIPLQREIVTTTLVNQMVDTAGITFLCRMNEDMAPGPADAARAFDATTTVFGVDEVFADIRAAAANTPAAGTDASLRSATAHVLTTTPEGLRPTSVWPCGRKGSRHGCSRRSRCCPAAFWRARRVRIWRAGAR